MNNNEFNNSINNDYNQSLNIDEYNFSTGVKSKQTFHEYGNRTSNIIDSPQRKQINLFKWICIICICLYCGILVLVPIKTPTKEPNITLTTRFIGINISEARGFFCYQLDFVDDNNYWSDYMIEFHMTSGADITNDIENGQEKLIHISAYQQTDILSLKIYCNSTNALNLTYDSLYNKYIIYSYVL